MPPEVFQRHVLSFSSFLNFYVTPELLLVTGTNGWMNTKSMGCRSAVGHHLKLFQTAAQHERLIHYTYNAISISAFSSWNLNSPKLRESLKRVINTTAQFSMVQVI